MIIACGVHMYVGVFGYCLWHIHLCIGMWLLSVAYKCGYVVIMCYMYMCVRVCGYCPWHIYVCKGMWLLCVIYTCV